MFIPTGAILLRLGLKSPIVLKLHAVLQILSYFLYIIAAGMGKPIPRLLTQGETS